MNDEVVNEQAWTVYGQHHLKRGTVLPEPERLDWAPGGTGSGAEVLGELAGKRVLDIGSGTGRYPAYLARVHGALVDAVEASASQHQRAVDRYGSTPGLRLIQADAVDYLCQHDGPLYDTAYSVHGLGFIDPHELLQVLAPSIRVGGRLVFSVLHTNSAGLGPMDEVTARDEVLPLAGGGELAVRMWALSPGLWEDLLVDAGFVMEDVTLLPAPEPDNAYVTQLISSRRQDRPAPRRISSRPRSDWPPLVQAAFGVAVILRGPGDQVLLGQHRTGVWECPGGKVEPGESIEAAAVRELFEETSLDAYERSVKVLAMLVDEVSGINRVTAVTVVTVFDGAPAVIEPHLVADWQWRGVDDLPEPLFIPTAQALRAWRPELPIDHPPVHVYRIARPESQDS
ncbi:NUDIX domain-containing protein [Streptomyces sp. NPDC049585]|uniref:bifunctional class I SAM-dependent methyltransferase/NUDIX hydrolase n=1 Tax=Streptomyces sp. NPDC049585 TaxID=3155154 RepID=UPI00341B96DE